MFVSSCSFLFCSLVLFVFVHLACSCSFCFCSPCFFKFLSSVSQSLLSISKLLSANDGVKINLKKNRVINISLNNLNFLHCLVFGEENVLNGTIVNEKNSSSVGFTSLSE